MPLIARLSLSVLLLAVTFASIRVTKAWFEFEVRDPAFELAEMPNSIGVYGGVETEVDDGVRGVLAAATTVNRLFRGPAGLPEVRVHAATWTDVGHVSDGCPHHPDVCYPAQGWKVEETERLEVPLAGGGTVPVRLALMTREFERVVVAHLYVIGDDCFTSKAEATPLVSQLRGQEIWPHVTKLMIQIAAADFETARGPAVLFSGRFVEWMREVEQAGAADPADPADPPSADDTPAAA